MAEFQTFGDDWVPYHAAMEPLRSRLAATQAAATLAAVSGIAITATASADNASDQIIAKIMDSNRWLDGLIVAFISKVYEVLGDPASLLHWTANAWAMLHEWLHHVGIPLVHLSGTGNY